ncbi:MAG: membrane protein insertase YidC, partial [Spirochaetales bacterium]|nr:membrane protein insertase YidC [Spirochaetales bacterium]
MDKNTIIAIVLSVVVISAGLAIQSIFFPPAPPVEAATQGELIEEIEQAPSYALSSQAYNSGLPGSFQQTGEAQSSTPFHFETDVFSIEFNPKGAAVSSLKLKKHDDKGSPVEMVFSNGTGQDAFMLYGGNDTTNPIDALFNYEIKGDRVELFQTFGVVGSDGKLTDEEFT